MLVASLNGNRVEAETVQRGLNYICPNCGGTLVLKRGKKRIAHFSHRPGSHCSWGSGESWAHLEAKKQFAAAFRKRGLRAEIEFEVKTIQGLSDRRTDVMVWSPTEQQVAIEVQHSSLTRFELEKRTWAYRAIRIPVLWVPIVSVDNILRKSKHVDKTEGDFGEIYYTLEKFAAPDWQKWIHKYMDEEIWFYDPNTKGLWEAKFSPYVIYVDPREVWIEGNYEEFGGHSYDSKKWVTLELVGPFPLDDTRITIRQDKAFIVTTESNYI